MRGRFTPTPVGRVIETSTHKSWIDAAGVAWSWNHADHDLTLPDAQASNVALRELLGGRRAPLLVVLAERVGLTHEARAYFGSAEVTSAYLAVALLAPTRVARMVGNLFLRVTGTPLPMRLFTDPEKAHAWLLTFLR